LAAKKELHRADARPRPEKVSKRAWSFVFVGNVRLNHPRTRTFIQLLSQLKPTVTEDQLRARFSPCGPILKIVIRCSSGQVTKKDVPFGPRDMRYATIEFRDSKAYLCALRLNGHLLDDVEMVVCSCISRTTSNLSAVSRFALPLLTSLRRRSGTDLQVPPPKLPAYPTAHTAVGPKLAPLVGNYYS